jgi:hypothetical protein
MPAVVVSMGDATSDDHDSFFVVGGSSEYVNNSLPVWDSIYQFDVASQTWSTFSPSLSAGRRELEATFVGCELFVVGGSDGAGLTLVESVTVDSECLHSPDGAVDAGADGNSADGNSADGNSADGNSADGNSVDGNSADGSTDHGPSTSGGCSSSTGAAGMLLPTLALLLLFQRKRARVAKLVGIAGLNIDEWGNASR